MSGGPTILALYVVASFVNGSFGGYNLFGVHPFIWSVTVTSTAIASASLRRRRPEEKLLEIVFGK